MGSQDDEVVGLWRQLMRNGNEPWWNGGLYRVERSGDCLVMVPENYDEATPGIIKSTGLTEVLFDGSIWRFKSDWENGRAGLFVLNRITNDLFEGHVFVDGRRWSMNRWERIAAANVRSVLRQPPPGRTARRHEM